MPTRAPDFEGMPGVGTGYAALQWSKALTARENEPDPAARSRANERIARWEQVIAHALRGTARYGSRTPFQDIPAWVTPEVVTGGFATGHLLAGGEPTDHERALAATLPHIEAGEERLQLNAWHLTDAGIDTLQGRIARGDYRIDVPEEAALPIVAWLLGQGRTEDARTLIATIAPFFGRLRFFPAPAEGDTVSAAVVHVFGAGEIRQRLAALPPRRRIVAQKQAIDVRLPLYDAAVGHVLATYADGWPCRRYPDGWFEAAAALCARFEAAQREGADAGPLRSGRTTELFALLAGCVRDPQALTGREVGRIRQIVDDFVHKYGRPDAEAHRARRARQRRQIAGPAHDAVAKVVAARLAQHPASDGIADFDALSMPITAAEADSFALVEGTPLPDAIRRRLERCRSGTVAELIACGLITSGDTMARVLPAMTAQIRSAGFADAAMRRLYAATYRAFRRRRSLLLLDLQSQVALEELPWIAAVEGDRRPDAFAVDAARQALVEAAALAVSAFPQAILPNKLLQEFRALAKAAQLDLPFVDEIAADIFMGAFSNKFAEAARRAARLLAATLYARYYAIDTDTLAALPDRAGSKGARSWWKPRHAGDDALAVLCAQRAQVELGNWKPAINGRILEQQQILTTQNLALLFGDLGLASTLHARLGELATTCFAWICARQQRRIEHRHEALVMLKNTAYAWRQMLFYLSMLDAPGRRAALHGIEAHFAAQPKAFRERFLPAMLGLRLAAAGQRLPQDEPTAEGARVFLGWITGPHWLLPAQVRKPDS